MDEIMDFEVVKGLNEAPNIGKYMFSEFVHGRFEKASKPLSDIIQRTNVYTFSNQPPVNFNKDANKLRSVKANTAVITNLVLSLQARPEALFDLGKLMSGTKSFLLSCLPGIADLVFCCCE
jgi:hypothetical protein